MSECIECGQPLSATSIRCYDCQTTAIIKTPTVHTYCSECKALESRALEAEKRSKEYAAECDRYIGELESLEAELSAAREENDTLVKENAGLKGGLIVVEAENEHLKALVEEILVENVGCTELRDLYRRKMISNKETKRKQAGE